jgi:uncharacterized protein
MLQNRPNCESCGNDLPPDTPDARICTYECTFCADCVDNVLFNVCPNCGGGFALRLIRPATEWRPDVFLGKQPASTVGVRLKWRREEIAEFVQRVRHINPESR